jgi:hypothetical protein
LCGQPLDKAVFVVFHSYPKLWNRAFYSGES